MTIFWQISSFSGIKSFPTTAAASGWVYDFLLANPRGTVIRAG